MQTDRRRIVSRDERVLLHDISRTTRARLPSTVIFISVTLLCGRGQKVGRVPTPVCAAYSKAAETSSLLLHRRRLRLSDITLCFFFPSSFGASCLRCALWDSLPHSDLHGLTQLIRVSASDCTINRRCGGYRILRDEFRV